MTQAENGVAIVDTRVTKIDICRAIGTRAGGDDDLLGHQLFHYAIEADHFDRLLVGEAGGTEIGVDAVAHVVAGALSDLLGDHLLGAF
ncbi:hypothetical protein MRO55_24685, partial [Escherichia coli]|uniref:hypothetical protein n=1 Tax=Escherichia coli TaxID=562 RepID=UPI002115193F|nr:hypothetical protein [Escherichia coli]